jgi:hypothetical protein
MSTVGKGSDHLRKIAILKGAFAGVAQLVEQLICNQPVASSSLVTSFPQKPLKQKVSGFLGFLGVNWVQFKCTG